MATDAGESKQDCGMPLLTDLAVMMQIDPLALIHEFFTVVYGPVMSFVFPDVQELCVVFQPCLGCGLFRTELSGTEGAERIGQR